MHASRPLHCGRAFAHAQVEPATDCPNCGEVECDCTDQDKETAALENCTGSDVRRKGEVKNERCAWIVASDWMGDPTIPNGTCSWEFAQCLACGAEVQQPYPDWLERKLPQPEDA